MKKVVSALFLISLFFPQKMTYAQDKPWERLFLAKSLNCTWHEGATGVWKDGDLTLESSRKVFSSRLESIDWRDGKASLSGNAGATHLQRITVSPKGVTFRAITDDADLVFITIFPKYKKGSSDFIAVTSRHISEADGPAASQYHGTCRVEE